MQRLSVHAAAVLQVANMLSLLIETSSDTPGLDTMTLCNLLQLNTACRQAICSSRGHHILTIKATQPAVAGLCAWLPRHAGLVAELRLQPAGGQYNRNHDQEYAICASMAPKLVAALQSCTAAAGAGIANMAVSTAMGMQRGLEPTAAPPAMQLLLTGFQSPMYVAPAVLQALPAANLTRLDLNKGFSYVTGAYHQDVHYAEGVAAALQHLSNLRSLKLIMSSNCWASKVCKGLPHLLRLTSLDVGPLMYADVSSFPSSLLQLKLRFEVTFEEPWPDVGDDPTGELLDEWLNDVWMNSAEEEALQQAAQLLDLSHLPLLQRCEVVRVEPSDTIIMADFVDYSDGVTVKLPHHALRGCSCVATL